MHKRIYKVIVLTFVFIISVILMSSNIKEEQLSIKTTVEMEDAKLPLLYITFWKTGFMIVNFTCNKTERKNL